MKNKKIKYLLVSFLILCIVGIGALFIWTQNTYEPTEMLQDLVSENDYKKIDDFYVFEPKGKDEKTGIVLYPGALVEPLAYGYYANELSKEGYLVAIPDVNLNLSITESDKADEFIALHPDITNWYVGGHSMGGVSATMYAEKNKEIAGVILLGSYPSSSTDLSDTSLKVLSIYGEKDGLTSLEDIERSKQNLPSTTVFEEIPGGNHAQFGMYGKQKGDQVPDIDVLEQQNQMIQITLNFLKDIK